MDNNLLRLIYHETSHILEQNKQIPPEYEKLCAAEYKGGSWTRSWNLNTQNYLKSGFISPYSSDNVHEDFVEFIAHYIVFYQKNQCGCETTDATADMAWMMLPTPLGKLRYSKEALYGKKHLLRLMVKIKPMPSTPERKSS